MTVVRGTHRTCRSQRRWSTLRAAERGIVVTDERCDPGAESATGAAEGPVTRCPPKFLSPGSVGNVRRSP
jgi:hypothetical protein